MGIHYLVANVVTKVSTANNENKEIWHRSDGIIFLNREVWNELTERWLVCFRIFSLFIQCMTGGCPERHN